MITSPGITITTIDRSAYANSPSSSAAALVGTATKGPLGVTVNRSAADFVVRYGEATPDCYAVLAALRYFLYGDWLNFVRVGLDDVGEGCMAYSSSIVNNTVPSALFTLYAATPGTDGDNISYTILQNLVDAAPVSFNLMVFYKGELKETWRNLTLDDSPLKDATRLTTVVGKMLVPGDFTTTPGGSKYLVASITSDTSFPPTNAVAEYLEDGNSGLGALAADYVGSSVDQVGIGALYDSEESNIDVVACPGQSDETVTTALLNLCESRQRCFAILDPPTDTDRDGVIAWHADMDSSRGGVYWPWINIGGEFVPPSVGVVAQFAYNDRVGYPWLAPAGQMRGVMTNVLGTQYQSNKADRDMLYADNRINPIVSRQNVGVVIWGQKTLQKADTAFCNINVRRLVDVVEKHILEVGNQILFEPNNRKTWVQFTSMLNRRLSYIQSKGGLEQFLIVVDETTVTSDALDRNEMPGLVFISRPSVVENIGIGFILTASGVNFSEI